MIDMDEELQKLLALTQSWDPKAKAKAFEEFRRRSETEIRKWYCSKGRSCDGEPHEGFTYPHARSDQWPPAGLDWFVWLIISGRGAGKTRTGSEWVRKISELTSSIAIIGRRVTDVRATMIEGPSGLIPACEAAGIGFEWAPSKKEFTLANGAVIFGYSAEEPDSLRGRQHGAAWLDEPAHMPLIDDVWYNLTLGLRVPGLPGGTKVLCTSTPLPTKWIKAQVKHAKTRVVRVSSYVNRKNLDQQFVENVLEPMEGTRIGRQEIHGEILEDVPGALWNPDLIVHDGITWTVENRGVFDRIIVSIDPAGTNNRRSDETGIIVVAVRDKKFYVLEDVSGKFSPDGWATAADRAYERWQADAIVAEKNYGGDMVKATIEQTGTRARIIVKTAMRSKALRAEPVVAQYERRNVVHNGMMNQLEDEMLTWVPGKGDSPNRIDALVWAIEELGGSSGPAQFSSPRTAPEPDPVPASASAGQPANSKLFLPPTFHRRAS